MNILLIGAGGRESALAWKLAQSPKLNQLYIAPGNAGTSSYGENISIKETDFQAIKNTVLDKKIDMVVVGPEAPLVLGIHDFFLSDSQLNHVPVIGPNKAGAMLEGSKDFSKQFMLDNHIPTAKYKTFTKETIEQGYQFLATLSAPYVLKADGLAAGKGVVIPFTLEEAKQELNDMLTNEKFGHASHKIVIEEFLQGIELSVFVLTDGVNYKILPSAKDYKRIGEGDTGPNTGGMGAISPVPFADAKFIEKVETLIVQPTLRGLHNANITYKGFIFIGLMNVKGEPFVIEYNCRLGDPETEVVIPRIKSDLVDLFQGVAEGNLNEKTIDIDPRTAATVMLVSGGYPGDYAAGKKITGLENIKHSMVFPAGAAKIEAQVVTTGGRVLAITSYGSTIQEAVSQSLMNAAEIEFEGKYYRKDIGKDLITQ